MNPMDISVDEKNLKFEELKAMIHDHNLTTIFQRFETALHIDFIFCNLWRVRKNKETNLFTFAVKEKIDAIDQWREVPNLEKVGFPSPRIDFYSRTPNPYHQLNKNLYVCFLVAAIIRIAPDDFQNQQYPITYFAYCENSMPLTERNYFINRAVLTYVFSIKLVASKFVKIPKKDAFTGISIQMCKTFWAEIIDKKVLQTYIRLPSYEGNKYSLHDYLFRHNELYPHTGRLLRESKNILPLLKFVHHKHWSKPDVFSYENWFKKPNFARAGARACDQDYPVFPLSKNQFSLLKKQPLSIINWYSKIYSQSGILNFLLPETKKLKTTEKFYIFYIINYHFSLHSLDTNNVEAYSYYAKVLPKLFRALILELLDLFKIPEVKQYISRIRTFGTINQAMERLCEETQVFFRSLHLFTDAFLACDDHTGYLIFHPERCNQLQGLPSNANWQNYVALSDRWHEAQLKIEAEQAAEKLIIKDEWDPILEEQIIDNCKIKPLNNNVLLYKEGQEMRHCVGSDDFLYDCIEGDLIIFAIVPEDKKNTGNYLRSTVAYSIIKQSKKTKYEISQAYSYCNDILNDSTYSLVKKIKEQLNNSKRV